MAELGTRPWWAYTRAVRDPRRIRGVARLPYLVRPVRRVLSGYLLRSDVAPSTVRVRTPIGWMPLRLRHPHDYATLVEVLAEEVYPVTARDRVVVDIGANIGVFSVYALTRHPHTRVHSVEPVPENLAIFRENVAPFADRVVEHPLAAAVESGRLSFGVEPTGRYGGIGVETGVAIDVPTIAIQALLTDVLAREGRIDVLKVDVEGLERDLLAAVPADLARRVGRVACEWSHDDLGTLDPWRTLGFRLRGGPKTWVLERPRQPL